MHNFKHYIIDTDLPEGPYSQTALADINHDGKLEFITGIQYGDIYYYRYETPTRWTRFLLGKDSPSDVGAIAYDVDNDGWIDFVVGGAWYKNSREDGALWEKYVYDPDLTAVHDVALADIDGDGRMEVITMSDQNDLRWYKIPEDPTQLWPYTYIGPSIHSGASGGDLTGNGHADVVRSNAWFENVNGNGTKWVEHRLPFVASWSTDNLSEAYMATAESSTANTDTGVNSYKYIQELLADPSKANATHSYVCDMDKDGDNDIVMIENEITGGALWWLENVNGDGSEWVRHDIMKPANPIRGALHTLWVGDLDGDGDFDIFSCEMDDVRGDGTPKYYIWENADGRGRDWNEHVILDVNLGGHAAQVGDISGNGRLGIVCKPWLPDAHNALNGKPYVIYLEDEPV